MGCAGSIQRVPDRCAISMDTRSSVPRNELEFMCRAGARTRHYAMQVELQLLRTRTHLCKWKSMYQCGRGTRAMNQARSVHRKRLLDGSDCWWTLHEGKYVRTTLDQSLYSVQRAVCSNISLFRALSISTLSCTCMHL